MATRYAGWSLPSRGEPRQWSQAEDQPQSGVDCAKFVQPKVTYSLSQPTWVDGARLFHEHPRLLAVDLDAVLDELVFHHGDPEAAVADLWVDRATVEARRDPRHLHPVLTDPTNS